MCQAWLVRTSVAAGPASHAAKARLTYSASRRSSVAALPKAGSIRAQNVVRSVRYLRLMAAGASTAQDLAERVLAQIEAALRIAEKEAAPPKVVDELRAIHRRLHQIGLRHDLQGSFF